MMLLAAKPEAQSLMQIVGDNPEWFLFRVSTITTTAFVFIRWVIMDAINSMDEIQRRREEAMERKRKKLVYRKFR